MPHMPPQAGPMHPPGQLPPGMHPGMRPGMPPPGPGASMMAPHMSMAPNGVHAMAHMQPGLHQGGVYSNNPQLVQGAFPPGQPQQFNPQNPQHVAQMRQRQMVMAQQGHLPMEQPQQPGHPQGMMHPNAAGGQLQLPQHMMNKAMQNGGTYNPAMLDESQRMAIQERQRAAMQQQHQILNLQRQQQLQQHPQHQQQQQHQQPMTPAQAHAQAQAQAHASAVAMQRQLSMQSQRDPSNQGGPQQPQHIGQPPGQTVPHTPQQNAQMQRPRPPPPSTQAQAPQQHPQAQTPQPQMSGQPQPPDPAPPQNHPGPPQPTAQMNSAPHPRQVGNPQQPQRSQLVPQNAGQQAPQANQTQQQAPQTAQPQPNAQQQAQQQIRENEQRAQAGMQMRAATQANQGNIARQSFANLQGLLKLGSFCQNLNELATSQRHRLNVEHWDRIVNDAFVANGTFRTEAHPPEWSTNNNEWAVSKNYEISAAVLGRYFQEHFLSGVSKFHIALGGADQSGQEHPTTITYHLDNGLQVLATGTIKMHSTPTPQGPKLDLVEFLDVRYEEFFSRRALDGLAVADAKHSPEKTKSSAKQKQAMSRSGSKVVPVDLLPTSPCDNDGIYTAAQKFVDRANILSRMRDLFDLHQQQPESRPREVFTRYMQQSQSQDRHQTLNVQHNMAMQAQTQGHSVLGQFQPSIIQQQANGPMRTPGLNGPQAVAGGQYFPSPAHGQLGLTNHGPSHVPSHDAQQQGVHQYGMQAPSMMAQGSHQGLSSNPSSHASPVVPNKRHRASVVKNDVDGSEGMGPPPMIGGQNKVKQSPRPGKKQKGN